MEELSLGLGLWLNGSRQGVNNWMLEQQEQAYKQRNTKEVFEQDQSSLHQLQVENLLEDVDIESDLLMVVCTFFQSFFCSSEAIQAGCQLV